MSKYRDFGGSGREGKGERTMLGNQGIADVEPAKRSPFEGHCLGLRLVHSLVRLPGRSAVDSGRRLVERPCRRHFERGVIDTRFYFCKKTNDKKPYSSLELAILTRVEFQSNLGEKIAFRNDDRAKDLFSYLDLTELQPSLK